MANLEYINYNPIKLNRKTFVKEMSIDDRFEIERRYDYIHDKLIYSAKIDILCSDDRKHWIELPKYSVPLNWWESVKERFFPKWLLNRWPVRTRILGGGQTYVEVNAMFPELVPLGNKYQCFYYVSELKPFSGNLESVDRLEFNGS